MAQHTSRAKTKALMLRTKPSNKLGCMGRWSGSSLKWCDLKAAQNCMCGSRVVLGGFWARVGLEREPPKRIRKTIFLMFERLNDSTNIANPSPSHLEGDGAPCSTKACIGC